MRTPTESDKPRQAQSRRISIRSLFVVTALCAALLGVWRAFIYQPPTHKIPLYEKARATRTLAAVVGPNRIAIESVARNRADGSIAVESGAGARLSTQAPGHDVLADCSRWMDVAQIELRPAEDRFEIIEARVFDHTTRTLISQVDRAFGWQVVNGNLLQLYGIGKELPATLDIWLRAHSYEDRDYVSILLPMSGSTVSLPEGTVSVSAVQDGFAGWSSATGFAPVKDGSDTGSAIVLNFAGNSAHGKYQIAATSVHGDKQFVDRYFILGGSGTRQELITLNIPLDELKQLELRRHGGRHRFFFEAVQLPVGQKGRPFDSPPREQLPVEGKELEALLSQFAPLRVRIAVTKGANVTGFSSNGSLSQFHTAHQSVDAEKSVTVSYHIHGVGGVPLSVDFFSSTSGDRLKVAPLRSSQERASSSTHQATAETYSIPIDRIETIEVSMPSPK